MITVTDRQRSVEAQAEVWEESQEMNGNKGKICVNQSWMMGKKLKWEGGGILSISSPASVLGGRKSPCRHCRVMLVLMHE